MIAAAAQQDERRWTGAGLVAPIALFILVFLVFPAVWIIRVSFNQQLPQGFMIADWVLANYVRFLGDPWYLENVLWSSLKISVSATLIDIAIAYPMAMFMVRCDPQMRKLLYLVVVTPLLMGTVSLVFGWMVLFRTDGLLNSLPIALGVQSSPLRYMYDERGVYILLVYTGIPYVVLTLLDSLERIGKELHEAAANVGATAAQRFWHITLPLTAPGLYAGAIITFSLSFSATAIPLMIGPPQTSMIGMLVYQQAMQVGNLPFTAAVSVVMFVVCTAAIAAFTAIIYRLYLSRLGLK